MKHTGIVLRHYEPQKAKIALLDQHCGRIDASVRFVYKNKFCEQICSGTVVTYELAERGHFFTVHLQKFIDVPLRLAKNNILFLHHLLELCYFFIPAGGHDSPSVFDLIQFLYCNKGVAIASSVQKLFLLRFFALLGIHSESIHLRDPLFHYWISCPLSVLFEQQIAIENERLLDVWLINCVNSHPMVGSFRTVRFLDEVRVP